MTSTPQLESVQAVQMIPNDQKELLDFVVQLQTAHEAANAYLFAGLIGFLRDTGALTPPACDAMLQSPRALFDLVQAGQRQALRAGQGPPLDPEMVGRILDNSTDMVRGLLELFQQPSA